MRKTEDKYPLKLIFLPINTVPDICAPLSPQSATVHRRDQNDQKKNFFLYVISGFLQ